MRNNRRNKGNVVVVASSSLTSTTTTTTQKNNHHHHKRQPSSSNYSTSSSTTENNNDYFLSKPSTASTWTATTTTTDHYIYNNNNNNSNNTLDPAQLDLAHALRQVEGNLLQTTWREIMWGVLFVLCFAALSLFLGFAAGMTISIHYHYHDQRATLARLEARERESGPHLPRMTRMDQAIAMSNTLRMIMTATTATKAEKDGLGRVIYTSPNGQRRVLQVVEETYLDDTIEDWQNSRRGLYNRRITGDMVQPPRLVYEEMIKVRPKLCADGTTEGYDDWETLRAAIQGVNAYSAEKFLRWSEYFAATEDYFTGTFDDPTLYYEEQINITICPGARLKARGKPIFINAENILLHCDGCVIDGRVRHFSFGPHAKSILLRGMTFRQTIPYSLLFHHDGAEASFEDCVWITERLPKARRSAFVADVNSTSILTFYRCHLSFHGSGGGGDGMNELSFATAISITLRSK